MLLLYIFLSFAVSVFASHHDKVYLALPFRSIDACGIYNEVQKKELVSRVAQVLQGVFLELKANSREKPCSKDLHNKLHKISKTDDKDVRGKWVKAIKGFLKNNGDVNLAAKLLAPIIARSNDADRQLLTQYLGDKGSLKIAMDEVMNNNICKDPNTHEPIRKDLKEFLYSLIPKPAISDLELKRLKLPFFHLLKCGEPVVSAEQLEKTNENATNIFAHGIKKMEAPLQKMLLNLVQDNKVPIEEKAEKLIVLAAAYAQKAMPIVKEHDALYMTNKLRKKMLHPNEMDLKKLLAKGKQEVPQTEDYNVAMILAPLLTRASNDNIYELSLLLGFGREKALQLAFIFIRRKIVCGDENLAFMTDKENIEKVSKFVDNMTFHNVHKANLPAKSALPPKRKSRKRQMSLPLRSKKEKQNRQQKLAKSLPARKELPSASESSPVKIEMPPKTLLSSEEPSSSSSEVDLGEVQQPTQSPHKHSERFPVQKGPQKRLPVPQGKIAKKEPQVQEHKETSSKVLPSVDYDFGLLEEKIDALYKDFETS